MSANSCKSNAFPNTLYICTVHLLLMEVSRFADFRSLAWGRPRAHIYDEGKSELTLHLTAILPEWLRGRTRNALAKAAKVRILRIANFPFRVVLYQKPLRFSKRAVRRRQLEDQCYLPSYITRFQEYAQTLSIVFLLNTLHQVAPAYSAKVHMSGAECQHTTQH